MTRSWIKSVDMRGVAEKSSSLQYLNFKLGAAGLLKFHRIDLPPWCFRQMVSTTTPIRRRIERASLPTWVKPQLATLVKEAPDGSDWLHEIKLDGYRMHARLEAGRVRILTRRGNDWTDKYRSIAKAIAALAAQNAYLDGELCGVLPDGKTAFNLIQNATDTGQGSLVFFLFDLLFLDGENLMAQPLVERKSRLTALLKGAPEWLRYNDHQIGHGPAFHRLVCQHGLEGIVSKHVDGRYEPDRRSWLKTKCLNREEFVVVGWSDPEGSRHRIGSLLLGYYTPDGKHASGASDGSAGKLIYAGRAGTGMPDAELERLWHRLQPLAVPKMPIGSTAARRPVRLAPGAQSGPLGAPGDGGRGHTWSGPLTGCCGMSSTWESARTSRQSMCAVTHPASSEAETPPCATTSATTSLTATTSQLSVRFAYPSDFLLRHRTWNPARHLADRYGSRDPAAGERPE
jgi:DNA ligase D-like protein (predicted ligase)